MKEWFVFNLLGVKPPKRLMWHSPRRMAKIQFIENVLEKYFLALFFKF